MIVTNISTPVANGKTRWRQCPLLTTVQRGSRTDGSVQEAFSWWQNNSRR